MKVQELRTECRKLREENVDLRSQTNSIESYSRRDNLIVYGIPESNSETPVQCANAVKQFLVKHMNFTDQEVADINFVRCHKLHTTMKNSVKPIIVRFRNFCDQQNVRLRKATIKGRNFNIGEVLQLITSSPPDIVVLGCGDNAIALIGGLHGCLKSLRSENHTPRFHLFNRSITPYIL